MKNKSKRFVLATVFSALFACGEEADTSSGKSSTVVAGGFVSDDVTAYSSEVTALDKKTAAAYISQSDFFYFSKSGSTLASVLTLDDATPEPATGCGITQDEVLVSEAGKELTIKYAFDDTTCVNAKSPFLNQVKVLIRISCSKTSLAEFAKKKARSFLETSGAREFCGKDSEQKTFVNAEYVRTGKEQMARAVGGLMRSDGSPCVATVKNGVYSIADCNFLRRIEKSDLDGKNRTVSKLLRFDAQNLESNMSGRYFAKGKVTMRVNNWTGPMTYSSDNTSPTFEINNEGISVKGSFAAGLYE